MIQLDNLITSKSSSFSRLKHTQWRNKSCSNEISIKFLAFFFALGFFERGLGVKLAGGGGDSERELCVCESF